MDLVTASPDFCVLPLLVVVCKNRMMLPASSEVENMTDVRQPLILFETVAAKRTALNLVVTVAFLRPR